MKRILVVDDEQIIRDLMAEIIEDAGHHAVRASTAEEGLKRLEDASIALVVSDIVMPGLSGLELLEAVRLRRPSLPVVLVTGAGSYGNLTDALAGGADGFVIKPFSHAELQSAVTTALDRAGRSERELKERLLTPTLAGALANAIEARDRSMHGHCERLSAVAMLLATRLGLGPGEIEAVRLGAILHDIGKIGIPDWILLKPGSFTPEELALMRTHPVVGDKLLEPLDLLASVRPVVRHHHERWDGNGYPDGLRGDEIPLHARIVALADAIEAMSAHRPYRRPLHPEAIVAELEAGRGVQWDPRLVDVALELIWARELVLDPDGVRVVAIEPEPRAREEVSVLLVEDDPAHAALAARALECALGEVRVVHVSDARSATKLFTDSVWSIAVLDDQLPDGRGIDLLATLHVAAPEVPIVMMTEEGSERLAVEAVRRGAADYVVKGNGYLDELAERVCELLGAS